MAKAANGLSISEEEPLDGPTLEPAAYEFQTDLSEDDFFPALESPSLESPSLALDLESESEAIHEAEPEPAPAPAPRKPTRSLKPVVRADQDAPVLVGTNIHGFDSELLNGNAKKAAHTVRVVDIEVPIPWLSPSQRAAFEYVHVEDEDFAQGLGLRRRHRDPDDDYFDHYGRDVSRKRKRNGDDAGYGSDILDDSDQEDEISQPRAFRQRQITNYYSDGRGRRSARASTQATSLGSDDDDEGEPRRRTRELRPRPARSTQNQPPALPLSQENDVDELQNSDKDDGDFFIIQSDIVRSKTRKRLRPISSRTRDRHSHNVNANIEFKTRRSSRANKNTKVIIDYVDDDDIFYEVEEKAPATPRFSSMRETFQPASSEDFKEAHRRNCDSCGYVEYNPNKGPLIHCQGCSNSYHRLCLGTRNTRDQRVTKVGQGLFVMQCRFCIGTYKKKDARAPSHDVCTGCHTKGPSCAPFSQKKTPKQEEKLRVENGGVDPVTPVAPNLINNPKNVLFRCVRCHRAWHYEHLPHPNKTRDPAIDDPQNLRKHRLDEYQISWHCKECMDTEEDKVDKLVAWRPVNRSSYTRGQTIEEFTEDEIEYLVKWEKKSYNHCTWLPGPWVFGVVLANMRLAFVKRTHGESADDEELRDEVTGDSLVRWTLEEAVHDSWITPDIVLDVQYAPRSREAEQKYKRLSRDDRFDEDKSRIFHVIKILVKFEGLGYDDVVWDTPPPSDSGAMYDAYVDAYHEYLNGKHFESDPWRTMKEHIEEFRDMDFSTEIQVKRQPKGLKRGKLMDYQIDGLNWMLYNFRHQRSVILADEMGLGKTVQVVALLSSFIQDNPKIWPFLIVVPNSTCPNWRREIKKWAPDLRVVAYYGGRASQGLAHQYELFPGGSRDLKAHVVIMSYDSAKDPDTRRRFAGVKWAGLVVDEAQALKNDENTLYKALNGMNIQFKLLLTGTPLQNNKRELFNLLQFVDPSIRAEKLDERFAEITKENLPELHELIRPYFLRRTKAMVLTFLPPMAQIIIPISMSVLQEKLCKSIMERNPELIRSVFARGKLKATERGSLSNILMQLRKCLCHPFVYSQSIEDRNTENDELTRRNLVEASSKLMLLEIMLPKLKERGHRVLIFSQFLDQLTILEDFMTGLDLKHERLDGSQSSMEKQRKIDLFNAPDSKLFAMLLSTRAGGVGINLATADTVIILDPDWNPHQDIQALSRAHRIGQQKKVLCFQLMTVDSAEEKILQIGRKKMALDHLLIETMDEKEGEVLHDVESVLKHGAAALFGEGEKKERISYDSAAIDKLLDRSMEEQTKLGDDKSAESAFALARVWAQDKGGLSEDLEESKQNHSTSVWDEIIQQREEEARREKERELQTLGRGGRRRNAANYTGQRHEFEEGGEALPPDSDAGSGDEDFVGAESEAESSDGEDKGEFSIKGSNSRKLQGKGLQGTKVISIPPTKAVARSMAGKSPATPKTTAAASKKTPSQTASSRKGQTPKPKKTPTPRTKSAKVSKAQTGTPSRQPAKSRSSNTEQQTPTKKRTPKATAKASPKASPRATTKATAKAKSQATPKAKTIGPGNKPSPLADNSPADNAPLDNSLLAASPLAQISQPFPDDQLSPNPADGRQIPLHSGNPDHQPNLSADPLRAE
ncbi:PHD/FYVE-zinc-finger like domain-containing protein [Lasiosphaeria ovina]|uniref:PHD/FYVE-zinc-finger like domain-containing protein n=1 Tax=Lasiosphaeria ovina TaxID=92902 RepID=A0AAE0KCP8_9PEZI|nr:PHD/FYVE-zinc-finger like domain-containing protein [Lasiosphaeria ovina]